MSVALIPRPVVRSSRSQRKARVSCASEPVLSYFPFSGLIRKQSLLYWSLQFSLLLPAKVCLSCYHDGCITPVVILIPDRSIAGKYLSDSLSRSRESRHDGMACEKLQYMKRITELKILIP